MMKNKVIETMASAWDAYQKEFGKKDNCCYVVVENKDEKIVRCYKTYNGAYKYVKNNYGDEAIGLSKVGIVIVEGKEVEDYIEAQKNIKEEPTYNVGDILEGSVSCGTANPFYNDTVKLVVKRIYGKNIEVQTVDKRMFEHHIDTFNKHGKLMRSQTKRILENYVGWLDQSKEHKKVYDSKLNF